MANRQITSEHSISAATMGWIAAGILVSLGASLQLGELGYGPYQPANRWLFSLFAKGAWHMTSLLDGATLQYTLQYWPLLLVFFGLAILPLAWHGNRTRAQLVSGSRTGEDHGS